MDRREGSSSGEMPPMGDRTQSPSTFIAPPPPGSSALTSLTAAPPAVPHHPPLTTSALSGAGEPRTPTDQTAPPLHSTLGGASPSSASVASQRSITSPQSVPPSPGLRPAGRQKKRPPALFGTSPSLQPATPTQLPKVGTHISPTSMPSMMLPPASGGNSPPVGGLRSEHIGSPSSSLLQHTSTSSGNMGSPQSTLSPTLVYFSDSGTVLHAGPYTVGRDGCRSLTNHLMFNSSISQHPKQVPGSTTSTASVNFPHTSSSLQREVPPAMGDQLSLGGHSPQLGFTPPVGVPPATPPLKSTRMEEPMSPIAYELDAFPSAYQDESGYSAPSSGYQFNEPAGPQATASMNSTTGGMSASAPHDGSDRLTRWPSLGRDAPVGIGARGLGGPSMQAPGALGRADSIISHSSDAPHGEPLKPSPKISPQLTAQRNATPQAPPLVPIISTTGVGRSPTTGASGLLHQSFGSLAATNSLPMRSLLSMDDLEVQQPIDKGASGEVFRAVHRESGRIFAVKRVDVSLLMPGYSSVGSSHAGSMGFFSSSAPDHHESGTPGEHAGGGSMLLGASPKVKQLRSIVYRELHMLHSNYRSAHVLKTYNAFFDAASMSLNIVMEFMDYGSLSHLGKLMSATERRAPLPERILAVVAEQVLLGLRDMHERGHIHRDVKPTNILVNRQGNVKLSDFGLSETTISMQQASDDPDDDIAPHCSGTDQYMSPERQRGETHGAPADIWALGLTMAECAVGRYPIDLTRCRDGFERMERMASGPQYPATVSSHLSDSFRDFVCRAMAKNPVDRPTAVELLEHELLSQWKGEFDFADHLRDRVQQRSMRRASFSEQQRSSTEALVHQTRKLGREQEDSIFQLDEDGEPFEDEDPVVMARAQQQMASRRRSQKNSTPGGSAANSAASSPAQRGAPGQFGRSSGPSSPNNQYR